MLRSLGVSEWSIFGELIALLCDVEMWVRVANERHVSVIEDSSGGNDQRIVGYIEFWHYDCSADVKLDRKTNFVVG